MKNGQFSEEELAYLNSLDAVERATPLRITYSKQFKEKFIQSLNSGQRPKDIFESVGLPASFIGYKRIERCCAHWKESAMKDALCLTDDKIPTRDDIRARERKRASVRVAAIRASRDRKIAEMEKKLEKQKARAKSREEKIIASQRAEIERLKSQVKALKANGTLAKTSRRAPGTTQKSERFELILQLKTKDESLVIEAACEALEVSKSGYYEYIKAADRREERIRQDKIDEEKIMKAYMSHNAKKGSRLIVDSLYREQNIVMSRKKVQRLMRILNISGYIKRKRPYKNIGSDGEPKIAENIVNRNFMTGKALEILSTDITYLPCSDANFVYMSAVIDCETRRLLAYKCSTSLEEKFVIETHEQLKKYKLSQNVIEQSDQGVHYTAKAYREILKEIGIRQSMSRRGCCHDNAPIESFWGRMKEQLGNTKKLCADEVMQHIDEYVDYYNNYRGQARLNKMTPVEYERELLAA